MVNQIPLTEAAYDFAITKDDRIFAYSWLNSWPRAEMNLRHFNRTELKILVVYEVNNKRRTYVVNRLLARLSKVTRQQEWKELQKIMEAKNARARDRAVSMSTSGGARRNRNKTDIF